MITDEFKTAYIHEINQAKEEYQKWIFYYEKTTDPIKLKEIKISLDLAEEKIKDLRNLINYPLYTRYSVMDEQDFVILTKKMNDEINEELHYIDIKVQRMQDELSDLVKEKENLWKVLYTLDNNFTISSIIDKIGEINNKIPTLESDILNLNKDKDKLIKEKSQTNEISLNNFKSGMMDNLKDIYISNALTSVKKSGSILTEISNDKEKMRIFLELSDKYTGIVNEEILEEFDLTTTVGIAGFKKLLSHKITDFDPRNSSINENNLPIYNDALKEYKTSYNEKKHKIPELKISDLQKLFEPGSNFDPKEFKDKPDFEFIESHAGHFNKNKLQDLKEYCQWYEYQNKVIIKTRSVKRNLEYQKKGILKLQSEIYKEISQWYLNTFSEFETVLGSTDITDTFRDLIARGSKRRVSLIDESDDLFPFYKSGTFISLLKSKIENSDKGISEISSELEKCSANINEKKETKNTKLENIKKEANEFFGDKFNHQNISLENGKKQLQEQNKINTYNSLNATFRTIEEEKLEKQFEEEKKNSDVSITELQELKEKIESEKNLENTISPKSM